MSPTSHQQPWPGTDAASPVLVGGVWRPGRGARFEVDDPATGEVVATVTGAAPGDAPQVVEAAAAALPAWAATGPRERSEVLRRIFESMTEHADALAELIVVENGKSLADARAEVTYAAEFFRWYAEEAVRVDGHFGTAPAGAARTVLQRRPVGVSVLVAPWNFPAAMITRKVAPALAAGCTVVVKPAAETPLTAMALASLMVTAGVPDGVVNLVPTDDAGPVVAALLDQPAVRKLSFTGSTAVGAQLLGTAAGRILNCSMELGGNAPFVVTDTADVAAAVDGAMVAKFRNGGQACTAANRFYVHRAVADEFVTEFGRRISRLAVGPGTSGADVGPMITARARDTLAGVVDDAVATGATVVARAEVPSGRGHFLAPVLLTDVPADAPMLERELFGPVAPVVLFDDEDEVVAMANGTEAGLSAYVYDRDLQRALRLAESFEVGMVGINRGLVSDPAYPFGGLRTSGLGREGGAEGMEAFLETQYVSIGWPQ